MAPQGLAQLRATVGQKVAQSGVAPSLLFPIEYQLGPLAFAVHKAFPF
jgi:hypothetical protein